MLKSKSSYTYLDFVKFSQLYNWSVQYLNDSKIRFNTKYPLVQIKEFLTRNKTAITVQDEITYQRVTIRIRNGGVILRDEVKGTEIGTKKQFQVSAGQFILSKIDARNGAMGIIPENLDGAIVTQDFLAYDIDTTKINPQYLVLVSTTKQFIDFCQSCSSGTTNRQRVDENKFLNIQIPLPLLAEQNKLVEEYYNIINEGHRRYSEGLIKIREARVYLLKCIGVSEFNSNGARSEISTFDLVPFHKIREWGVDKILHSRVYLSSKYETASLSSDSSLYLDIKRGKSPKYAEDSNVFILNQKCVRWGAIETQYAKTVDSLWLESIDEENLTQEGDILINSTGEGTIGRAAVVDRNNTGLLYDSHVLLLRLNKNCIEPQYFELVFNSRYGQEQVENVKSAKTTKQTELGVENLKRILIPIPPLKVQQDIVEHMTELYKEASDLQQISPYYQQAVSKFESQIFE